MTDFATHTNAQLNRWAAERDNDDMWLRATDMDGNEEVLSPTYADRADLAIALLGRWGYEWTRGFCYPNKPFVDVHNKTSKHRVYESPECDTARALVIAANSLKESEGG